MKKCIQLVVCILFSIPAFSQDWAGPNKESCGSVPAIIGIQSNPCPNCCYVWSPGTKLNNIYAKNPEATPDETTEYTLTVMDENLHVVATDKVTVTAIFKEMVFTPDFIIQGSGEPATAEVLESGSYNLTWSLPDNATLNCTIPEPDAHVAEIIPGLKFGKLEVRATNDQIAGCYLTDYIDVNNGVKDVVASDIDHPGRMAHAGETLYVFGHGNVNIKAIPNPGGFADGVPNWTPDQDGNPTLEDEDVEQVMTLDPTIFGHEAQYIAGEGPDFDPKVTVIRQLSQTAINTYTIPQFEFLADAFEDIVKYKDSPDAGPPACGPHDLYDISLVPPAFKLKLTPVEKYQNPGWANKQELVADAAIEVSGKLFHPVFTKTVGVFGYEVCSRVWIGPIASMTLSATCTSDPSLPDDKWFAVNVSADAELKMAGGAEIIFSPPGYNLGARATASIGIKAGLTLVGAEGKVYSKYGVSPATAVMELFVEDESDPPQKKKLFPWLPSAEIQFTQGWESTPALFFTLPFVD